MKLSNGMEMEIYKTWYNKTKVQEDGITQIVDPTPYTAYQFGMAKNYFNEDKIVVVDEIIKDLQSTIMELEKLKQKELDSKQISGIEER